MWGLESVFGSRGKAAFVETPKTSEAAASLQEAKRAADIAITNAKKTGAPHEEGLHNPNQYGAEASIGPRTAVLKSMPIAEDGFKSLQISTTDLESALQNPTELGGPAEVKPTAAARQAAARAESLSVDPKQVEAALVSGQLPDPIAIKKMPWQPDMFVEPRTKVLKPTPTGTAGDLRTKGNIVGVEDDWKAAQRAVKTDNPDGLKSLRTPGGVVGVEDAWKATKRAVEGEKAVGGLGEFRTAPKELATKREVAGVGLSEKRKNELRHNAELLILRLRKMIDTESDENELRSMRARLVQAERFYDEEFK